ncbi:MAG TPA: DUF542 domain-containing protein [Saprospiraceae bacterium]|nr:DUF542 domain-containing protein [Saprospiraceae bacterium]
MDLEYESGFKLTNLEHSTVGDVVTADYRTATIFRKHHIDFACCGDKLIKEVCTTTLLQELEAFITAMPSKADPYNEYQQLPLDVLISHLRKKHHDFAKGQVRIIKQNLDELCMQYRRRHPELNEICNLFYSAADMLATLMSIEESELFPFFANVHKAWEEKNKCVLSHSQKLETIFCDVKQGHRFCTTCFQSIRKLSNGYSIPADACNLFRLTYIFLEIFETDLLLHIHTENNILFPRVSQFQSLCN